MKGMISNIRSGLAHPASRRLWLTIGSGVMILAGLIARYGFGQIEVWWVLMIAAALFAGWDIAIRAWRALRVKAFSIELLVTVAAVGALFIGEVWEAAAVTFLFMFGGWLEARTMGQTRGALKALLDAAPATATVLRDGDPVEVPAHMVQLGETVLVKAGQAPLHSGSAFTRLSSAFKALPAMKAASTESSLRARGVAHTGTRGTRMDVCGAGAGCRLMANIVNVMCGLCQYFLH